MWHSVSKPPALAALRHPLRFSSSSFHLASLPFDAPWPWRHRRRRASPVLRPAFCLWVPAPLSLSLSLWFPGNVVCSLDNVERCASFGAQAWLLTLPHVAVRCGVVRRQRCVFACQMVLYRFLVTLPSPPPSPSLHPLLYSGKLTMPGLCEFLWQLVRRGMYSS